MPDTSDPRTRRMGGINKLINFRRNPPGDFTGKDVSRWITEEEGLILYYAVQEHQISRVYECGTANGYSTSWLVQAMIDAGVNKPLVRTWDPINREKVWKFLAFPFSAIKEKLESFSEYIRYYESEFRIGPADLEEGHKTAYFIDGDHGKGAIKRDWEEVEPLMKKGDLVILHDAHGYAWINRLAKRIANSEGYSGGVINSQRGIGLAWKT